KSTNHAAGKSNQCTKPEHHPDQTSYKSDHDCGNRTKHNCCHYIHCMLYRICLGHACRKPQQLCANCSDDNKNSHCCYKACSIHIRPPFPTISVKLPQTK